MSSEVLGREQEFGSLCAFLDRPSEGLAGFALEGEPGIGKSTLWTAVVESARERGFSVLASRPAEAERDLAYVVLGDLFEDVLADVLPALPTPRRRALEATLLVDQAPDQPVDPRALGVAVRTALQTLAQRAPLLLAVDDEQWVDAASASALRFALRRLPEERISLLVARRLDPGSNAAGLEEAIDPDAVERLALGPLSLGALHLLLQRRLDRGFARRTLLRVLELSGGNPFYALELARAHDPAGDPIEAFPLPESLERLVGARLQRLSKATRRALLLVAAHGRPTSRLLVAAGVRRDALEAAVSANVVERSGDVVRFVHPLLASVLYRRAPLEDRRTAHERLAAAAQDPVERGRHLALVFDEPDAEVAGELEKAAAVARARGAALTAAELAEHALRLSPPAAPEKTHRRSIAAARSFLEAGELGRARGLATDLLARAEAGVPRAEALVLMSDIEWTPNLEHAIELRLEALEAAAGAPRLQAEIQLWLGDTLRFAEGVEAGARRIAAALELAESLEDDDLRAEALGVLASSRFRAGLPGAAQLAEEATRLAAEATDPRVRAQVGLAVALPLVWSCELERARPLLEAIEREWSDRDERTSDFALWLLGLLEFRAGRFSLAADYAERSREIGRHYTLDEREEPTHVWLVALIAAHRGDLERARGLAEQARVLAESQPVLRAGADGVLGLVALWTGDPEEAATRFAEADDARRGTGVSEPALFWWHADRVEALLALGRLDEAARLLDAWQADAERLGRTVVLAHAARCRGLLAAARGDVEEALAELERAIPQHDAVGDAFGRARTSLALGVVRRRARQKRAARDAIEAALAAFGEAGAAGWADRARAELGRIGGRTREEGLTAAERRVAALVAEGRSNREVAAALFLGERTVETHLSRVYAKLGLRSRAQLARTFRSDEQSSGERTISS